MLICGELVRAEVLFNSPGNHTVSSLFNGLGGVKGRS